MDENPITGKPGEFFLSSTGRKGPVNLSAAASSNLKKAAALPALDTKVGSDANPLAAKSAGGATATGRETKSPKTPGGSGGLGGPGSGAKAKKRKSSKASATPS